MNGCLYTIEEACCLKKRQQPFKRKITKIRQKYSKLPYKRRRTECICLSSPEWKNSFTLKAIISFSRNAFTAKKECILAAKAKSSTYPRERASRLSQSFTFFLKERNGNEVLLVGTNLNFLGCVYIQRIGKKSSMYFGNKKWEKRLLSCVHMCKEKLCERDVHALANTTMLHLVQPYSP